jgi:hypothetical protein
MGFGALSTMGVESEYLLLAKLIILHLFLK